jgi:hypothetical protein
LLNAGKAPISQAPLAARVFSGNTFQHSGIVVLSIA